MSKQSNFSDKEIAEHVRKSTSKKANVDYDKLRFKNELRAIIAGGTLEEFEAKLIEFGRDPRFGEGRVFVQWFKSVRGSSLR